MGKDYGTAVFYPEDERFLIERDLSAPSTAPSRSAARQADARQAPTVQAAVRWKLVGERCGEGA